MPNPTVAESPAWAHQPHRLVVVGAASGMGRWLGEHFLSGLTWTDVLLVDAAESILRTEHSYQASTRLQHYSGPESDALRHADTGLLDDTCVLVAVPLDGLADVAAWLGELVTATTLVVDTSHHRSRAAQAWGAISTVGLHPLFGVSAPSIAGQTFALCTDDVAPQWLVHTIREVGGTLNVMTNERHDQVMDIVQRASHEALLSFADVVGRSGLELETDLWANRTPVFELLLALAVRVLQPGQDTTTASIQAGSSKRSDGALREAVELLADTRAEGDAAMLSHLAALREPFSGGLFAKINQTGTLATSAVQSSRAQVADHLRAGELIGVHTIGSPEKLHVGRIVEATPTSFTIDNLLVGSRGQGALLLDDLSVDNARRAGIGGKSRRVEFRLGRVVVLSPIALEAALDDWLATVSRGCKVFIPEQISGSSAVRVVLGVPGVTDGSLVTEEVRIGQRECVIRYSCRIDRDLARLDRAIQRRVDETFVWPDGAVLPVKRVPQRIGYLGPAGTFSDVGARQLARLVSDHPGIISRFEFPDFPALVAAVADGTVDLAVLPITNSSSGLVDLAAGVLAEADPAVTAGGVVDVPVRFDAYVAPGTELVDGGVVYSHPQGFRQCSQFVAAHRLQAVECSSTAEACLRVVQEGRGVALAATGMNDEFGVVTARSSVGNLAGALTRFLVLGRNGMFGEPVRADALLRTVWLVEPGAAGRLPLATKPRFDEILRGPSGRTLLVSTDPDRIPADTNGTRRIATIPWSPRTPLVVVE
jgi:prephenate dehydratase/prephenate dehydrogenase